MRLVSSAWCLHTIFWVLQPSNKCLYKCSSWLRRKWSQWHNNRRCRCWRRRLAYRNHNWLGNHLSLLNVWMSLTCWRNNSISMCKRKCSYSNDYIKIQRKKVQSNFSQTKAVRKLMSSWKGRLVDWLKRANWWKHTILATLDSARLRLSRHRATNHFCRGLQTLQTLSRTVSRSKSFSNGWTNYSNSARAWFASRSPPATISTTAITRLAVRTRRGRLAT